MKKMQYDCVSSTQPNVEKHLSARESVFDDEIFLFDDSDEEEEFRSSNTVKDVPVVFDGPIVLTNEIKEEIRQKWRKRVGLTAQEVMTTCTVEKLSKTPTDNARKSLFCLVEKELIEDIYKHLNDDNPLKYKLSETIPELKLLDLTKCDQTTNKVLSKLKRKKSSLGTNRKSLQLATLSHNRRTTSNESSLHQSSEEKTIFKEPESRTSKLSSTTKKIVADRSSQIRSRVSNRKQNQRTIFDESPLHQSSKEKSITNEPRSRTIKRSSTTKKIIADRSSQIRSRVSNRKQNQRTISNESSQNSKEKFITNEPKSTTIKKSSTTKKNAPEKSSQIRSRNSIENIAKNLKTLHDKVSTKHENGKPSKIPKKTVRRETVATSNRTTTNFFREMKHNATVQNHQMSSGTWRKLYDPIEHLESSFMKELYM